MSRISSEVGTCIDNLDRLKFIEVILNGGNFNLHGLHLNREIDRRASFSVNNWQGEYRDTCKLALLGFYFFERPDSIKCYFCNLIVENLGANADPVRIHSEHGRSCNLMARRPTTNVPLNADELENILPHTYDTAPINFRAFEESSDDESDEEQIEDVKYPKYKLEHNRVKTFKDWPKSLKQKPNELAAAGFFYTGIGDKGKSTQFLSNENKFFIYNFFFKQ